MEIKGNNIVITVSVDEFERYMKRKPKNQGEFDEWVSYVEEDLASDDVIWQNLFESASYTMRKGV